MRALVVHREPRLARRIARIWTASGFRVDCVEGSQPPPPDQVYDLVGTDEFDREIVVSVLSRSESALGVLWSAEDTVRGLSFAVEHPRIMALLGQAGFESTPEPWLLSMVAGRAARAVQTKDAASDPRPPASAFYSWGGSLLVHQVQSTDALRRASDSIQAYCSGLGLSDWLVDHAVELAHELLMNGLYDAPVDSAGAPRFAHDRKATVSLEPHERVQLRVGCDGVRLVLQVEDPFGGLRREQVFGGMARGLISGEMDQSHGGAGLGMAMCYRASSVLLHDVVPGISTVVTAVLGLEHNRRSFRTQARTVLFAAHPRSSGLTLDPDPAATTDTLPQEGNGNEH